MACSWNASRELSGVKDRRIARLHPSFGKAVGKKPAWSLQSEICLQETTKDSCLVDSQNLAVYFKGIFCTNWALTALGKIPAVVHRQEKKRKHLISSRAHQPWLLTSPVCSQSTNPHRSFPKEWKCWVPAAATEQNYLCLKDKLVFWAKNTAASTIPTKMRFSEFCPKERARGRRDADGNNQSPHSKRSFEIAKGQSKAPQRSEKMWAYILVWVYLK